MTSDSQLVLVVDDDPSMRSSISRFLRTAGHRVQTYCGIDDLELTQRPDVPCCLILDVVLPRISGLHFKDELNRRGIRIPTVFITGSGDIPMSVRAMKGGAIDFLTKPFDVLKLENAVARALDEDKKLLPRERETRAAYVNFGNLTARERQVFFAVTRGLSNRQVALKLGISEKTIKVHRAHVMQKMGADSFAALVKTADLLVSVSGRCDDGLDVAGNSAIGGWRDLTPLRR